MRIYVMGANGAGKTPFAEGVGKVLALPVVSMADWIKPLLQEKSLLTKQETIDASTDAYIQELKVNIDSGIEWIVRNVGYKDPAIIEGIRNPYEFIKLFDLQKDLAVFLNRDPNPYRSTNFENGLLVIDKYLNWTAKTGLLNIEKRVNYKYSVEDIPEVIDNFIKLFQYRNWCLECGEIYCSHKRK